MVCVVSSCPSLPGDCRQAEPEAEITIGHHTGHHGWKKYIYFAEPEDRNNSELLAFRHYDSKTMQSWPDDQKTLISNALDEIYYKCPALITAASNGRRLAFIRVITLKSEHKCENPCRTSDGAYATAGMIVFDNQAIYSFTNARKLLHFIVHELIHRADATYGVAFSEQWRKFARKKCALIRLRSRLSSRSGFRFYSNTLRDSGYWPSLYGATNFSEALAEYLSWQDSSRLTLFRSDNENVEVVRHLLLSPSADERLFNRYITDAQLLIRRRDQKKRVRIVSFAKKLKVRLDLFPFYYLLYGANAKEMQAFATNFQSSCDDIGLKPSDPLVRRCYSFLSTYLTKPDSYDAAAELLDSILFWEPTDISARKRRAILNLKLNKLGAALDDEYRIAGYYGLSCYPLTDIDSDPIFVDKAMQLVSRKKDLDERTKLNTLAQYNISRASSCKHSEDRTAYYDQALRYYEQSLHILDKYKLDTLIECFNLAMHLHRYDLARNYYEQACFFNKDAIVTRIAEVKLLQHEGFNIQARKQYDLASILIKNANVPYESYPPFDFSFLDEADIKEIDADFLHALPGSSK